MLTDAFFARYAHVPLFDSFEERHRRFLSQVAQLIVEEVLPDGKKKDQKNDPSFKALTSVISKLERELGVKPLVSTHWKYEWKLPNGNMASQMRPRSVWSQTTLYLTSKFTVGLDPDHFIKRRISFVELAYQERAASLVRARGALIAVLGPNPTTGATAAPHNTGWTTEQWHDFEKTEAAFKEQVHELNERFRHADIPLVYQNNLIHLSDDALSNRVVEDPFWQIVADQKWQNVDLLLKEAIDRRDNNDRDAVSPAMQGLESVIKIISNDNGWTTGNENGAANYINNLVPLRNGVRFIEVWESEALIKLFGQIRNYFGHGPGSAPIPALRPEQTAWVIENVMIWVKSLIRRT